MCATRRTGKASPKKKSTSTKKKKGKVYIPPYKAIILCLSVIVVCVILLLISTLAKPKANTPAVEEVQTSITERFEPQEEKQEKLSSPELPKKEEAKPVQKTEKKSEKKTEQKTAQNSEQKSVQKNESKQEQKTEQKSGQKKEQKTEKKTEQKSEQKIESAPKKTEEKKATGFGFEKAQKNAQLCFVFDDGGQNLEHLKKFLELPFPITVAVLPQITHSVEAAELVRKSGNELILHQPMQSVNANINPGPGAITPDMSDEQIVSQLFVNLNQIGPVAGMNNHEGSGITADAEKMEVVLQMASDEGIYFLDSRTNVETKVPYVAGELGYSYFERNIFLDNEKTRENALAELKKGLALANKTGSVIMIGHIWSADFLPALLKEAYPELKAQGYTFSVVSTSRARKN